MEKDRLSLMDLSEVGLRKRLFRDAGETLSGRIARGTCTDGPDSIAKLMERAFQTGLAMRNVPGLDGQDFDVPLPLTDSDLPASVRRHVPKLRQLLGFHFDGSKRRPTTIKGMALVMHPQTLERRDQWLSPILNTSAPFGLSLINTMVQLGLYQPPVEVDGGWMVTYPSEWGFELLVAGKTSDLKHRVLGASSTHAEYKALLNDLSPFEILQETAVGLGFVTREELMHVAQISAFRK